MRICDDLKKVYDERWFHWKGTGGIVEIKEEESQASVKGVTMEHHGQLLSIDKDIFGKTDCLYKSDDDTDETMPKLRHSCDGIFIIERREQKFIVFIELKSKYSESNIRKAEMQICASFLRLMSLLNCLENGEWTRYKKCGIIVSHPVDDEYVTFVQKKKSVGKKLDRYERQCLAFKSNNVKDFPIKGVYSKLGQLPVNHNLLFEELPTFHININENDSTGHFNLEDILKKL